MRKSYTPRGPLPRRSSGHSLSCVDRQAQLARQLVNVGPPNDGIVVAPDRTNFDATADDGAPAKVGGMKTQQRLTPCPQQNDSPCIGPWHIAPTCSKIRFQ